MAAYGTTRNYLRAYGGPVGPEETTLDEQGHLSLVFSRPVVFPRELISEYSPSYQQEVPPLTPTDEELAEIDGLYEDAVEAIELLEAQVTDPLETVRRKHCLATQAGPGRRRLAPQE